MEDSRSSCDKPRAYSFQRSAITALVVFVHGMLGLLLLAPASPRHAAPRARHRPRPHGQSLILVFLKPNAGPVRHRRPDSRFTTRRVPVKLPRPKPSHGPSASLRKRVATQAVRHSTRLRLTLPPDALYGSPSVSGTVPRYVPGGRAFQQRLQSARRRRQRQFLPGHTVPGMPHFAMRDPRMQGMAGALHFLAHNILGAADPACVEAGTDIAMTDKQRTRRHISLQQVKKTLFEHRCVLRPASWMAPQGPATHMGLGVQ